MHVRLADDAYALTDANGLPYLDIEQIIARALESGANAIHPGYGFLAENASLPNGAPMPGIIFVGPSALRDCGHGEQDRSAGNCGAGRSAGGPGHR